MKSKFLQSIVLTLGLIVFNSSYSWAEAFKSGPSDNEMKVVYFLLLSMVLLIGITFALFFAAVAKKFDKKNPENARVYYLYVSLGILLGLILILPGAAFPLTVIITVFSLLGMLIYKSNSEEMNIVGWFFTFLGATIVSGIISFVIMITTLL